VVRLDSGAAVKVRLADVGPAAAVTTGDAPPGAKG
jgi:hypothetical protein